VWLPACDIRRVRLTDHETAVADSPNFIDGVFVA
jgi:hypothetical protein